MYDTFWTYGCTDFVLFTEIGVNGAEFCSVVIFL